MKRFLFLFPLLCAACTGTFSSENESSIVVDILNPYPSPTGAKSGVGVPDVDNFVLTVVDSGGNEIYHGRFADSPDRFGVQEGIYTVSAVSCEFDSPEYGKSQLGDSKTVVVPAGSCVGVRLVCSQLNSGVLLDVSPEFRSLFPYATLYMKGEGGTLMYSYGEKRIAYFKPGSFSLSLVDSSVEKPLMTKVLDARQILRINLTVPETVSESSDAVSLTVDTSRVWVTEDFCYGGGQEAGQAMSVTEALTHIGEKDVWIYGYIVGACASSSKMETVQPFSKSTNIVISSRTSVSEKSACIAVELPAGDIRNALNLVDNPLNLGRKVLLRGNLVESYFSMTGLKSTSFYEWR